MENNVADLPAGDSKDVVQEMLHAFRAAIKEQVLVSEVDRWIVVLRKIAIIDEKKIDFPKIEVFSKEVILQIARGCFVMWLQSLMARLVQKEHCNHKRHITEGMKKVNAALEKCGLQPITFKELGTTSMGFEELVIASLVHLGKKSIEKVRANPEMTLREVHEELGFIFLQGVSIPCIDSTKEEIDGFYRRATIYEGKNFVEKLRANPTERTWAEARKFLQHFFCFDPHYDSPLRTKPPEYSFSDFGLDAKEVKELRKKVAIEKIWRYRVENGEWERDQISILIVREGITATDLGVTEAMHQHMQYPVLYPKPKVEK